MGVLITYCGDDDQVLAQVAADAPLVLSYEGCTQTAIERAFIVAGVTQDYFGCDLNMIEHLAEGAGAVVEVYGLSADVTLMGAVGFDTHDAPWLDFSQTLGSDGVNKGFFAARPTHGTVPDFSTGPTESGVVAIAVTSASLFDASEYDGSFNGYQVSLILTGTGGGVAANAILHVGHAGAMELRVYGRANGSGASETVMSETIAADEAFVMGLYIDKTTGYVGAVSKRGVSAAVNHGYIWSSGYPLLVMPGGKWPLLSLTDNTQATQDFAGAALGLQVHAHAAELAALGLPWPVGAVDVLGEVI